MFGYICINKRELKVKDYELYRAYYCGLCRILKKRYGRIGQLLLNYDMTFLVILLTGLYEPKETAERHRCVPHPFDRHEQVTNRYTEYAADMNILLSYQKALDDWEDEKSKSGRVLASLLKKDYMRLRKKYPRQSGVLEKSLHLLVAAQRDNCTDLDYVSGLTGRFLGELFTMEEDLWQDDLRTIGFYLGKFVYLIDAFEDMDKDRKNGNYNLFLAMQEQYPQEFGKRAEQILVDMMSQCSIAFERLPILKRSEILRNILYSGVWYKYQAIKETRTAAEKKKRRSRTVNGADAETEREKYERSV